MSEEDAFLDGIATNRADRTRLLVFADWLADRSDPREEFVRLHARLLDMDGTEPEFAELEKKWVNWTASASGPDCLPHASGKLSDHWLDAVCRVCSAADVEPYLYGDALLPTAPAERLEFDFFAHKNNSDSPTSVLYHGLAGAFGSPVEFVASTVLADIRADEWFDAGRSILTCYPITRGNFWLRWRECLTELSEPPAFPIILWESPFLGGQYFSTGWSNWALVGLHQHDYFALFRCFTD
jgi:uncharacterized protein (TIGR02996 family)